jgi:phage tail-like protein
MASATQRNDPFLAFNFQVDIDGITVAGFSECSGLTSESDHVEYRTGAEDITVRKLPALVKYSNVVCKRGYTTATELWQWRAKVVAGQVDRRSGSVTLLDENRQPALKWNFFNAWPGKLEGPAFNAKNNEVAIETLEIIVERLVLA